MEHKFGANWTVLKLEALKEYLSFYTQALKKQPFTLIYIDGFAGTGQVSIKDGSDRRIIDGSAKIALNTTPPFKHIYLVDNKPKHAKALRKLCDELDAKHASVHEGDANKEIIGLLNKVRWNGTRAVMFLDPYGLSVEWATLEAIANTKAVDIWFLFPLSGLARQAARNYAAVDPSCQVPIDHKLSF